MEQVGYGRADLLRGDIDGCYQIEAGAEGKIDFDVSLARNTRAEQLLFQHSLTQGKKKLVELNTCQKITDLEVEPDPIHITEGWQVKLDVKGTTLDLLTDQKKKGTHVDFQLLEVRVKDEQAITVTPSGIVTASENSPVDKTVLTLSYEKAFVEVPVYIYEHGEDTFHGDDPNWNQKSQRYEKIARRITEISTALGKIDVHNRKRDLNEIEDELVGTLITKHFLEKFDRDLIGEYYYKTCFFPFPREIHPDFRLQVLKETEDELVMETVMLGGFFGGEYSPGSTLRLTFKKKNGKWLIHDFEEIGPLNAHLQEVINYFSANYDYLREYKDYNYLGEYEWSRMTVHVFKHRFEDEYIGFDLEDGSIIELGEKPMIPGLRE